ncbi:hypothetical protein [Sphingomonas sp. LT1P40]|uniref:hypothetical protein n=1 Tax=Alteristakelama amylovorans TaxID=3096166 RepID=UPI002FCCA012
MMKVSGFVLALAVTAAAAPPAAAQERTTGEGQGGVIVDAIAACRTVTDSTARLACFDKAAGDLAAARERKDLVVLDRAEVQKTRRSLFGFTLPRIKLFGGGDDEDNKEDIPEINGRVAGVLQIAADRWQVTLDDDTRWITTESARGFPPRSGEAVRIQRGALGSYNASFNKRRSLKVRRIG